MEEALCELGSKEGLERDLEHVPESMESSRVVHNLLMYFAPSKALRLESKKS